MRVPDPDDRHHDLTFCRDCCRQFPEGYRASRPEVRQKMADIAMDPSNR